MEKVLPSPQHLKWADCEIGVIIHCDLQVFAPDWNFRDPEHLPQASCFNPAQLNTDQWLETAKKLGAKYAVFVAKHCTGFSMWPTKAHDYSVASSPWKNGRGDVVADFIRSCKKYDILPGLYCSCPCNFLWKIRSGNPAEAPSPAYFKAYADMVKSQLRELWTNYGDLFEIWFDGGLLTPGFSREVMEMAQELQPDVVAFQGDPKYISSIRWIGNERADAPVPCRARSSEQSASDGMTESAHNPAYCGSRTGSFWFPGEADMPNRDQFHAFLGGWFWREGEDDLLYPPEELLERYYSSVGRGCNWLLGMPIDNRGLVPDADVRQYEETGRLIREQYSCLRGRTSGMNTCVLDIEVPGGESVDMICVKEDISKGENVLSYIVSGFDGRHYHTLVTKQDCGHKSLTRIPAVNYKAYRLTIQELRPECEFGITEFSLWKRPEPHRP